MITKPTAIPVLIGSLFGLAVLVIAAPRAAAIDIVISGNPTETGSGPSLKARFSNVATVDGKSIDLFGEVVSQTSNKTNKFRAVGDDFKFQLQDGEPGEVRSATVRWTFYESGTTTPVSPEGFSLTIDDLDDYAGRTESFVTEDAIAYTVNEPTNVVASFTNGTTSAAGGAKQDSGDPESAIRLYFQSRSSFTITYTSAFYWEGNAGFVHDGDGDFVFSNPQVRLFYTYNFTNNEDKAVAVDFFDSLPTGLTWDTEFAPQVSGALNGDHIVYGNGNRNATIIGLVLQPGPGRLTLCTMGTSMNGIIYNEATITPKNTDAAPVTASTTIVLP